MNKRRIVVTMFVLLVLALAGGNGVDAQRDRQGNGCWNSYQQFTLGSYEKLERCIVETNGQSVWRRLGIRSMCNAEWVSNAWEAEAIYAKCMTWDKLF